MPLPPSALAEALASPPVVVTSPLALESPPAWPVMFLAEASPLALASEDCDSLKVTSALGPTASVSPPMAEVEARLSTDWRLLTALD